MKLLNLKSLAGELGVSYYYTRAMKAAGMPLYGGRISKQEALDWLRRNPDFRPTKVMESIGSVSGDHQRETAGKSGELLSRHD